MVNLKYYCYIYKIYKLKIMKKILLLLLVCILSLQTKATHLMGGQITSRNLGGLVYEVKLTLFRDTLGIPIAQSETITFTNSFGTFMFTAPALAGPAINIGNGVEKYEYLTVVTFPYYGTFKAYYNNCCRNIAILNIPNAGNYSMYLDVEILVDSTNSSPVFLNDPITLAQENQPFSYNPAPFDTDGDSLSWVMDTPLEFFNSTGSIIPGYTLPPSDTLVPFNLDTLTGEITFLPNTIGNFQISVKAIEWRNGVQIGYIRRDMQLIVVPSVNSPVLVSTTYSTQRSSSTSTPIYVQPNQLLTFNFNSYDTDFGSTIVNPSGSIFMGNNPAVVTLNTPASQQGSFTLTNTEIQWTPDQSQLSNDPYYLIFRVGDVYGPITFYNDYTFRIFVSNSTTGIDEINNNIKEGVLIRTIDVLGREIDPKSKGLVIRQYDNGTSKKIFIQE